MSPLWTSSLDYMLLRLRWLTLGAVLALCGGAVVVTRMVRMRRRFTADNLRRVAAVTMADGLDWAAQRLRGAATPRG
jgi:hypothetical protein